MMRRQLYIILGSSWLFLMLVMMWTGQWLSRQWSDGEPSNCLLFALRQEYYQGGTVEFIRSKYGPWLHCRYRNSSGLSVEFNPRRMKRKSAWWWPFPPLMFHGVVRQSVE